MNLLDERPRSSTYIDILRRETRSYCIVALVRFAGVFRRQLSTKVRQQIIRQCSNIYISSVHARRGWIYK